MDAFEQYRVLQAVTDGAHVLLHTRGQLLGGQIGVRHSNALSAKLNDSGFL